MNNKLIFGTLAGGAALFLVGGLLFAVLFSNLMEEWMKALECCTYKEPVMWPIVVANLSLAFLMSLVMDKTRANSVNAGVICALWFTPLVMLWYDMWMFASFPAMNIKMLVIDVIGNSIPGVAAGAVIGWVYSRMHKPDTASA
ncbi:MAG: hypothetical protein JNL57_11465 [Bacteroidetes bacterium]|nr:hypothetical protein [Bacteroidota bacterium]